MSKTPNYDAKVKIILDATKPGQRVCELTGEKWEMTEEEISWYRKFNVPPSRRHPMTRWWILTGFWLAYQWWWNRHAKTDKPIFTYVHPATGLRVLPDKEWFENDFSSIGQLYELKKSILEQMRNLQQHVPLPAAQNVKEPENSISMFSFGDVNSYFAMFSRSKGCFFCNWGLDVEQSAEMWNVDSVTNSYHIVDSHRIFDCQFIRGCFDCMNSAFLFDCRNCEYCFGATNKRNRKYLWWNEQLTKEEWKKRRSEVDFSCRSKLLTYQEQFKTFMQEQAIWPENFNEQSDLSDGEYLWKVNNVHHAYSCLQGVHDSYWITGASGNSSGGAFCAGNFSSNDCYYNVNATNSSLLKFTYNCTNCQNNEYSMYCYNCDNCFGCFGLQRKKFHIFNRSYSEKGYWERVDVLKCSMLEMSEYGEFFPLSMSPSLFEYSGASMYFDALSQKDIAQKIGAHYVDPEALGATGIELNRGNCRKINDIPDSINDMKDEDWVGTPIYDPFLKRRFVYLKPELDFYRKMKLAAPDKHFILRQCELYFGSNTGRFEQKECYQCSRSIISASNPTYRNRKIYCRSCYLKYLEQNG